MAGTMTAGEYRTVGHETPRDVSQYAFTIVELTTGQLAPPAPIRAAIGGHARAAKPSVEERQKTAHRVAEAPRDSRSNSDNAGSLR